MIRRCGRVCVCVCSRFTVFEINTNKQFSILHQRRKVRSHKRRKLNKIPKCVQTCAQNQPAVWCGMVDARRARAFTPHMCMRASVYGMRSSFASRPNATHTHTHMRERVCARACASARLLCARALHKCDRSLFVIFVRETSRPLRARVRRLRSSQQNKTNTQKPTKRSR